MLRRSLAWSRGLSFPDMFDRAWLDSEQYEEELVQAQGLHDGLTAILCGVNLQLGDDTAQFNCD